MYLRIILKLKGGNPKNNSISIIKEGEHIEKYPSGERKKIILMENMEDIWSGMKIKKRWEIQGWKKTGLL